MKQLMFAIISMLLIPTPAFAVSHGLRRLLGETLNNPTGVAISVLIGFMILGWLADQLGFLFNKKPLANLINNLILFSAVVMVLGGAYVLIDKVATFIFG
jgi:hypothetical protein